MKNKKPMILIITFLILLVGIGLFYFFNEKTLDKTKSKIVYYDGLRINYINGSDILIDSKNKTVTKKIEIKNETKNSQEYRLVFDNVINNLLDTSVLSYSYVCKSTGSACGSKSNIVAPTKLKLLTNKVSIEGNMTHTYVIIFNVSGDISSESFSAKISNNILSYLIKNNGEDDESSFWEYKYNIVNITFDNKIKEPLDFFETWDVSEYEDGSIMAYLTYDGFRVTESYGTFSPGGDPAYELHIQSTGQIIANPDSSNLFWGFVCLKEIVNLQLFDTVNVTNMSAMFQYCYSLENMDLSLFNTKKVTDMSDMFNTCVSLISVNLSSFDTTNVTDMSGMFSFYESNDYPSGSITSLDISNFDTSNVTKMSRMFAFGFVNIDLDLSKINTKKVTDMSLMFSGCHSLLSLDLSNFETSNVTDMRGMFSDCQGLTSLDVSSFVTSNVTDMRGMFAACFDLVSIDLNNFETSKVTDMGAMFSGCNGILTLDLSSFNTSNVVDMSEMFWGYSELISLNLSSFDTRKVTDMSYMFSGCKNLTSLDISNFITDNVIYMCGMFSSCENLINLDIRNMEFINILGYSPIFNDITSGINIIVKNKASQKFIEERLIDENKSGVIKIAT